MMMPGSFHGTRASGVTSLLESACEHGERGVVADRPVLHVDGQAVPALRRHDLGREAVRQLQPAVDRRTAVAPDLPQPIGPHGAFPPLAMIAALNLAQDR